MIDDVCQNTENVEEHYAFGITSSETKDKFVYVTVGGAQVQLLVDSRATVNVTYQMLWEPMKVNQVNGVRQKSSKELFA